MLSALLNLDHLKNQEFKKSLIDPHLRIVLKHCRDSHVHVDARELVPISELIEDNHDILDDDALYQDKLLPLVVHWFNTSFFSWFDLPSCERCSSQLGHSKSYLNLEEKVVEVYECDKDDCDHKFEFIRHNDPAILLHTRKGRCGEWAMCFLIILRSLNYQARIVYDSTDHVWNEIWSDPQQRWLHVDPCEDLVDGPLLYEVGWGKKLQYCLAFGQYEALDVTGRYVLNSKETRSRRQSCNEEWLRDHLDEITADLLKSAPSDRIAADVRIRRAIDVEYLRELTSKPQVALDASRFQGRKTGSFQWRLARGEYSVSAKSQTVIKACSNDTSLDGGGPIFSLRYNCDRNSYECSDSQYSMTGWSSLVYEYENIDHKYERDWKTSYLSRYESCPASLEGKIKWRFDLTNLSQQWKRIELLVRGKTYPNAVVDLSLSSYANCNEEEAVETIQLELNETHVIDRTFDLNVLNLVAKLSGGAQDGELAWQKAQLFRQTRGRDAHEWSFELKIF